MEDGDEALTEIPEEDEEEGEEGPRRKRRLIIGRKCNQRIDELATPQRRMFLALWNEHAYHFPEEKVENLKELLQRLYAMTPEETAKYFAELRAQAKAESKRRRLKLKLRKYLAQKHQQKQRERAYRLFRKILKKGLKYAVETPVPPLVSLRLRYLSNIILEQLCDLRKMQVPQRSNPCIDPIGNFLISVSDWIAIAIERLYYAAQQSINEMTYCHKSEESVSMEDQTKLPLPTNMENMGPPVASSTPRNSLAVEPPPQNINQSRPSVPRKYSEMSQPVASSTKKNSLLEAEETPNVTVNPYYSMVEKESGPSHKAYDLKTTRRFFNPKEMRELLMVAEKLSKKDKMDKAGKIMSTRPSDRTMNSVTKRIDSVNH